MNKTYTLSELTEVAKDLVASAKNKTLLFYGDMGVGKTTLIKEICKVLGVNDVVHSPTFSLVNEYKTADDTTIYHFDFYRIENEEEAYDMGVEDYFDSDAWCFVEWAENIKNLIPLNAVSVHLSLLDDGKRHITMM